jgi:addiction module RelB/DinJ family antitoxin
MVTTKIRSNVYLDKELKEKAKEIFKEYGLSLSDGINMLLNRVVKNKDLLIPKELDIEPIYKNDPDYKIVEKTRGEETISLEKLFELIENNKDITKDFLNDRNQPLPQEREIF